MGGETTNQHGSLQQQGENRGGVGADINEATTPNVGSTEDATGSNDEKSLFETYKALLKEIEGTRTHYQGISFPVDNELVDMVNNFFDELYPSQSTRRKNDFINRNDPNHQGLLQAFVATIAYNFSIRARVYNWLNSGNYNKQRAVLLYLYLLFMQFKDAGKYSCQEITQADFDWLNAGFSIVQDRCQKPNGKCLIERSDNAKQNLQQNLIELMGYDKKDKQFKHSSIRLHNSETFSGTFILDHRHIDEANENMSFIEASFLSGLEFAVGNISDFTACKDDMGYCSCSVATKFTESVFMRNSSLSMMNEQVASVSDVAPRILGSEHLQSKFAEICVKAIPQDQIHRESLWMSAGKGFGLGSGAGLLVGALFSVLFSFICPPAGVGLTMAIVSGACGALGGTTGTIVNTINTASENEKAKEVVKNKTKSLSECTEKFRDSVTGFISKVSATIDNSETILFESFSNSSTSDSE